MNIPQVNRFKQSLGFVLLSIYLLCSSLNIYLIPQYNISVSKNFLSVIKSHSRYANCSNLNIIRLFDKLILDDDHISVNKFVAKVILIIFGSLVLLHFVLYLLLPRLYLFLNKQRGYLIFLCFRI